VAPNTLPSRLAAALPRGATLPPDIWLARHRWMVRVVGVHALGLFVWGLLVGHPLWHAGVDAAPAAVAAAAASRSTFSRRGRAVAVCLGLLTSSAVVVHLMNGAIEDPYLLATAFLHHGVVRALNPGAFIAALSVVSVVAWKLNEIARGRTAASEQRFRWAFHDAPTGMALVSLDGIVNRVNETLCRRTGFTADEIVGRPLADMLADEDRDGGPFPAPDRR
jgi:PAS domain-containing protein